MAFRVDSLVDEENGNLPLRWGRVAVATGEFSDEIGRVLVDSEYAEIVTWTTSQLRFKPRHNGILVDGTYSIYFDNVQAPHFTVAANLGTQIEIQSGIVDHVEDVLIDNLQTAQQIQSGEIEQISAGPIEYFHDFTTGSPHTLGGFTFTHSGDATAFDYQNVLKVYGSNIPPFVGARFDGSDSHDEGTTRGLQLEMDRSNVITQSNMTNFSTSGSLSASLNQTDSQGRLGAAFLVDDQNTGGIGWWNSPFISSLDVGSYCASVRVKKAESALGYYCYFQLWSGTNAQAAILDMFTGDVIAGSTNDGVFGAIDDGDWWRLWVSVVMDNGDGGTSFAPAYSTVFDGNSQASATGSAIVCDAQLEPGGYPTSLIETSGLQVYRADTALGGTFAELGQGLPTGGVSNNFCGQVILTADWPSNSFDSKDTYATLLAIGTDTSNATRYDLFVRLAQDRVFFRKRIDGVTNEVRNLAGQHSWAIGDVLDIRFRASDVTGMKLWIGGVAVHERTDYLDSLPSLVNELHLSSTASASANVPYTLAQFRFLPRVLPDAEIEAWPTWP